MLPWTVRRTRLPLLSLRCVDCGTASATTGEGRFRVNANGKLLDVWLLVRCVRCDRTNKLTVHERVPVREVDAVALRGYRDNDPGLVAETLLNPLFAHRNGFGLDWAGAWRLLGPPVPLDGDWPVRVEVSFDDPAPVRPDRLIAHGLGLSRGEVVRRVKCEVSLRRTTSRAFSFTVLAGD
uniref:DUF1062 domain-containing protein n=1 Tax=Herbidospora sakaeratensis TaxID=564415 RepID=UPI001FE18C13|nr:DUF1062 domain-containing protein [Herbidospora sakaeratensis]